jgi:hypothetical protein
MLNHPNACIRCIFYYGAGRHNETPKDTQAIVQYMDTIEYNIIVTKIQGGDIPGAAARRETRVLYDL